MGKLRAVAGLYQKALLEFLAKCEWIGESQKPDCRVCSYQHADRLGSEIVREVFPKCAPPLRKKIFAELVAALASHGVTDFRKTYAAYEEFQGKKRFGKAQTLNDLLKVLYSDVGYDFNLGGVK